MQNKFTEEQIQESVKAYEKALRQGHKDGIEYFSLGENIWKNPTSWTDFVCTNLYRIKPEPKLRAWKPEEVPIGAIVRHNAPIGGNDTARYTIVGIEPEGAWLSKPSKESRPMPTDSLLKLMQFSTDGGKTWGVCGALE